MQDVYVNYYVIDSSVYDGLGVTKLLCSEVIYYTRQTKQLCMYILDWVWLKIEER